VDAATVETGGAVAHLHVVEDEADAGSDGERADQVATRDHDALAASERRVESDRERRGQHDGVRDRAAVEGDEPAAGERREEGRLGAGSGRARADDARRRRRPDGQQRRQQHRRRTRSHPATCDSPKSHPQCSAARHRTWRSPPHRRW
jgi:hypothetical protein